MKLIGGLKLGASAPGGYSFYGDLFSRLPKEVKHTGDLTRYVAFDYLAAANDSITFLGIEVDRIENIPDGMMAWEIDGDRLRVIAPGKEFNDTDSLVFKSKSNQDLSPRITNVEHGFQSRGIKSRVGTPRHKQRAATGLAMSDRRNGSPRKSNSVAWEADVAWAWRRVTAAAGKQRVVGEFSVRVPGEWTASGESEPRFFAMTANCYIAPGKSGPDDAVELVNDDPAWPEQFSEFSDWLQDCLGNDVALRIEHFGSTAIPGMIAKPVIDVLVQVPSFPEAKQQTIPLFNKKDWEYWWYGDHAMFIKRDGFPGRRTHHVHMMVEGTEFQKRLAFRDWLRSHPEDATAYARLKQRLADCHREDREAYTDAKTAFVKRIVAKANEGKNKEPR